MRIFVAFFAIVLLFSSCKEEKPQPTVTPEVPVTPEQPPVAVSIPVFDAASAYSFVENQIQFGTRDPGSPGHEACKDWLVQQFESYGATVIPQTFKAKKHKSGTFQATNIIAQFNPEQTRRILLSAHWDTRAVADYDPETGRRGEPIPGADDGGSGVAVLLEVARQLAANPINFGVDIVLFDAEDQGIDSGNDPLSWCQGAQYWGKNTHVKNYKALFGIHLDMVGAKNPRFAREGYSRSYAPQVLDKVWRLAQGMGFGMFFVNDLEYPVTDDHKFINEYARIPTINIINKPLGSNTGFGPHWHTHSDDINVIDTNTMKAVGQVVLASVYNSYMGKF